MILLLQLLPLLRMPLIHLLRLLLVPLLHLLLSGFVGILFRQLRVLLLLLLLEFLPLLILLGDQLVLLLLVFPVLLGISGVGSGAFNGRKLVGMDRRARCIERTWPLGGRYRWAALVDGSVQVPIDTGGLHMLRLRGYRWDVTLARK